MITQINIPDWKKCSRVTGQKGKSCDKPAVTWFTTRLGIQSEFFIVHARCADCIVSEKISYWIQISEAEVDAYYIMTR